MKPEWRQVLQARSVKDKFAIARSCDLAPTYALPIISELVREGYAVFVEPAWLSINDFQRAYCDVYQLTPKGIKLCDDNNIPQH
jgi:hypothetical protein